MPTIDPDNVVVPMVFTGQHVAEGFGHAEIEGRVEKSYALSFDDPFAIVEIRPGASMAVKPGFYVLKLVMLTRHGQFCSLPYDVVWPGVAGDDYFEIIAPGHLPPYEHCSLARDCYARAKEQYDYEREQKG